MAETNNNPNIDKDIILGFNVSIWNDLNTRIDRYPMIRPDGIAIKSINGRYKSVFDDEMIIDARAIWPIECPIEPKADTVTGENFFVRYRISIKRNETNAPDSDSKNA